MEEKLKHRLDLFFQITTIIFMIIPVYFIMRTTNKEITSQALIIFGIILGVFLIGWIFSFIYGRYKTMIKKIDKNQKDMEEIKKDLNFKDMFNKMDKRLSSLERFFDKVQIKINRKKGQIDPRIILWIIMLILLYLFLKEIGVF